MIEKKPGAVNEIIFNNTVYNNGENRYYPNIRGIVGIMKLVCDLEETTNYIRITPFYMNYKRSIQHEFEESMFYLECRNNVSDSDVDEHLLLCLGTDKMNKEEKRIGEILYPLCQLDDVDAFVSSIKQYIEYLDILIPKLMTQICQSYNLTKEDIGFGYFSFEVHSG